MAKRFRFRLEPLETLRRRQRNAQRRAVAEKLRTAAEAGQIVAQLSGEKDAAAAASRQARRPGTIDILALRGHEVYRGWLSRQSMFRAGMLTRCQAELGQEQERLAEATKRLRIIERLRQRRWARHVADVIQNEQREMDETAQRNPRSF